MMGLRRHRVRSGPTAPVATPSPHALGMVLSRLCTRRTSRTVRKRALMLPSKLSSWKSSQTPASRRSGKSGCLTGFITTKAFGFLILIRLDGCPSGQGDDSFLMCENSLSQLSAKLRVSLPLKPVSARKNIPLVRRNTDLSTQQLGSQLARHPNNQASKHIAEQQTKCHKALKTNNTSTAHRRLRQWRQRLLGGTERETQAYSERHTQTGHGHTETDRDRRMECWSPSTSLNFASVAPACET